MGAIIKVVITIFCLFVIVSIIAFDIGLFDGYIGVNRKAVCIVFGSMHIILVIVFIVVGIRQITKKKKPR